MGNDKLEYFGVIKKEKTLVCERGRRLFQTFTFLLLFGGLNAYFVVDLM